MNTKLFLQEKNILTETVNSLNKNILNCLTIIGTAKDAKTMLEGYSNMAEYIEGYYWVIEKISVLRDFVEGRGKQYKQLEQFVKEFSEELWGIEIHLIGRQKECREKNRQKETDILGKRIEELIVIIYTVEHLLQKNPA